MTAYQLVRCDSSSAVAVHPTVAATKRVLLVSYPFPPVGGAGVQRVTKFVKYLPQHGWTPSVLTVSNPSVPALDASLECDISPNVLVRRARSLEPGYTLKQSVSASGRSGTVSRGPLHIIRDMARGLAKAVLQPDPQVLWMPAAVAEGKRLLREIAHDAIVASGPPFSTFLIASALSRHSGIPLLLDYRDEWDLSNSYLENKQLGRVSRWLQSKMQRRVLRAASAVVATTQHSAAALSRLCSVAGSNAAVASIYNGFDPQDFESWESPQPVARETYRLAYVGTLWNLTSVAPLVSAVEILSQRNPTLAAKLELVFAGRRSSQQQQLVDRLRALRCQVVEHPYLDHKQALDLVRSADGLCVLLSDLPGAERVVPAKIFEYMAARRPVIAIGPTGEMGNILAQYPAALLHHPNDVGAIADTLQQEIRRAQMGTQLDLCAWNASVFDRRREAGELAELLDGVAKLNVRRRRQRTEEPCFG